MHHLSVNSTAADEVWINQGGAPSGIEGVFSDSGQNLGASSSFGVALGDLDGDGTAPVTTDNGLPKLGDLVPNAAEVEIA